MKSAFMYILECSDGSFYAGSTIDLEQRILEHNSGIGSNYTEKKRPVKLIYHEEYDTIEEAYLREKQIQKWSRKKKLALMNGEFQTLKELSKSR